MLDEQLWAAVEQNNRSLCTELVNQGADPNKKSDKNSGWSPLRSALCNSKTQAVAGMLASPQFKFTQDNAEAFAWSVIQAIISCPSYLPLLLSAPRDKGLSLVNSKAPVGSTSPLKSLIDRGASITDTQNLASLLVQHGDDPNLIIPGRSQTALEFAIQSQAWSVVFGILASPGFIFKIGVTEKALELAILSAPVNVLSRILAVTMAIKLTDTRLATHLLKLRKEAVERQESESIHTIQKYYSENKYISLDGELKKLDKIDPLKTIMLAMSNQYVDLTVYLIKSYFIDKPMDLSSVLRPAIEKGYVEVVRILLERKVDPNQVYPLSDGHKRTPLFLAVESKNHQLMEMLVSVGADINFNYKINTTDYTLIQQLIEKGHIEEVNWLIRRKEYTFTSTAVTELMYSIFHHHLETTDLILAKCNQFHPNMDSHVMHVKGGTVLYHAVNARNVKAIKKLMDLGTNPTLSGSAKVSPLFQAVKTSRDNSIIPGILIFSEQFTFDHQALEVLYLAIDTGKQRIAVQLLAKYGDSKLSLDMALWKASLMGFAPVVARLLELGANPNMEITGDKRVTPLWASLDKQDPETQELLLNAGANVHYGNEHETNKIRSTYTLLVDALVYGKLDSFLYFISRDEFKFKENTPSALLVSLKKGYMHIFDMLLEKYTGIEFNLDTFSYLGDKAIHIAVKSNNIPAVRSLLMRGSNPLVRLPGSNESALTLAADKPEIFELLVSLGQFEFDEHCVEVVLECIEKNQPDLALSLLAAHPPAATIALDPCFAPAMKKGYFEVTELLIRHGVKIPPDYAMRLVLLDAAAANAYWSKAPCKSATIKTLRKSPSYKNTLHSTYVENSQEIMELWDAKNPPGTVQKPEVMSIKKAKKASLTFLYDSSQQNCVEFDMLKEVDYGETAARGFDPGLELPAKPGLGK